MSDLVWDLPQTESSFKSVVSLTVFGIGS